MSVMRYPSLSDMPRTSSQEQDTQAHLCSSIRHLGYRPSPEFRRCFSRAMAAIAEKAIHNDYSMEQWRQDEISVKHLPLSLTQLFDLSCSTPKPYPASSGQPMRFSLPGDKRKESVHYAEPKAATLFSKRRHQHASPPVDEFPLQHSNGISSDHGEDSWEPAWRTTFSGRNLLRK